MLQGPVPFLYFDLYKRAHLGLTFTLYLKLSFFYSYYNVNDVNDAINC